MPRILIAECRQEVSSFNPAPSRYADYQVSFGAEILDVHRRVGTELGGALGVFGARADVELVPTSSHRAITSGGTLATADWSQIADEFSGAIAAALAAGPPPDGVYFGFHGAMAAADEDDPEGWLLAEARRLLGEQVPIVVSLDLHGIVTPRMLQQADALVVYHTYPHVDFVQTGERAAGLLLRMLDGVARPVTAYVTIPALVRGDELITATGLFGEIVRDAAKIEATPGGYSAGMVIGNPFTDVPALASGSLVVTDDANRSAREAVRLAERFWAVRERLQAPLVPLAEAVSLAKSTPGTTIMTDAADATSSGASGDSNAILRALVEGGYQGRVLLPIVDRPAVVAAFAAGVGNRLRTLVGGSVDTGRFVPSPIEARVHLLAEGRFRNESHGTEWDAGPTAVLIAANLTLVVTSRPVSLYDRSLFLAHGQDPRHFDLVVVKSPHTQAQFFTAWATRNINVDAPGSTSAKLQSLGHTRCARPIFPLDAGVTFTPQAAIYQRG